MKKSTKEANSSKAETKSVLDELIQQGARQIIQQAVEAELATLLEQYSNVKSIDGRRAVVRNGYLPEREVVTVIGQVTLKVPKVRDRSGSGSRFNSTVVPPYVRKSARVSAALPWLYLRGISTGAMSEAMGIMLGGQVSGMSPNVVSRLKAQWADEHEQWNRRDLSSARWVYGPAGIPGHRRGASGMRSRRFAIGMLNVVWLGDLVKLLWWSGDGLCLLMKRLEKGRFVWPQATSGTVCLSPAQLSMLLEGIDWRQPTRTAQPTSAL